MNNYEIYVELKKQKALIEAQMDSVNKSILSDMNSTEAKTIDTLLGKFTTAWRQTWQYGKNVSRLESQLKDLKQKQQENGTAKIDKVTQYIVFTPVKIYSEEVELASDVSLFAQKS